ncbi:hypothetical protein SAMN05421644_11517 [Allochromatium warmingii]|uniref:Uncharacterized protein n=1 Tax=Allochromatium warmingii TaxID=61595 RepID=A0A1H3EWT3_ALLWA|nr:hypothetical protein [Allochromatium warmingii]SDX83211.1 hypothetical protein SAMN05421644_11517 [Allochromatium warmingii]
MDSRWIAHLDSQIAAGQVAAEAESAELLSWLLKLEPEQRWCLVLSRESRLERLSAADYRRLLALMVEHEAGALTAAPPNADACLDELPTTALPVPFAARIADPPRLLPPPSASAVRPRWLLRGSLAAMVLGVGYWLTFHAGAQRLLEAGHWLAGLEARMTHETQSNARLERLLTTRGALETLERKLTSGEPFAAELTALQRLWPTPAQLAPLHALAASGRPTPEQLRARLERLQHSTLSQQDAALQAARSGQLAPDQYYARLQTLTTQRTQGETALTAAQRGDWTAAQRAVQRVEDADYQTWQAQVGAWLATQTLMDTLLQQLWSAWLDDTNATPTAAADAP